MHRLGRHSVESACRDDTKLAMALPSFLARNFALFEFRRGVPPQKPEVVNTYEWMEAASHVYKDDDQ